MRGAFNGYFMGFGFGALFLFMDLLMDFALSNWFIFISILEKVMVGVPFGTKSTFTFDVLFTVMCAIFSHT